MGSGRLEEEENTSSSARRLDPATNQLGAQTAQPPRGLHPERVWRAALAAARVGQGAEGGQAA